MHFWKSGTAQHIKHRSFINSTTWVTLWSTFRFLRMCHVTKVWDLETEVAEDGRTFGGTRAMRLHIPVLFYYCIGHWNIINEHGSSFRSSCILHIDAWLQKHSWAPALRWKRSPVHRERYSSSCHIHPPSPSWWGLLRIIILTFMKSTPKTCLHKFGFGRWWW